MKTHEFTVMTNQRTDEAVDDVVLYLEDGCLQTERFVGGYFLSHSARRQLQRAERLQGKAKGGPIAFQKNHWGLGVEIVVATGLLELEVHEFQMWLGDHQIGAYRNLHVICAPDDEEEAAAELLERIWFPPTPVPDGAPF